MHYFVYKLDEPKEQARLVHFLEKSLMKISSLDAQ